MRVLAVSDQFLLYLRHQHQPRFSHDACSKLIRNEGFPHRNLRIYWRASRRREDITCARYPGLRAIFVTDSTISHRKARAAAQTLHLHHHKDKRCLRSSFCVKPLDYIAACNRQPFHGLLPQKEHWRDLFRSYGCSCEVRPQRSLFLIFPPISNQQGAMHMMVYPLPLHSTSLPREHLLELSKRWPQQVIFR